MFPASVSRETERCGRQQLVIVERCDWKDRGVIVKLSFFLEVPGPAVVRRKRTRCAKTTRRVNVVRESVKLAKIASR